MIGTCQDVTEFIPVDVTLNSAIAGGPNEWQPYVKWAPVRSSGGPRPSLSLTGAWNGAAQSLDAEMSSQIRFAREAMQRIVEDPTTPSWPSTAALSAQ